jgi:hypothetical protein
LKKNSTSQIPDLFEVSVLLLHCISNVEFLTPKRRISG